FVVLFDGDRAGIAAAARSFSIFAEAGIFAEAAFVPEGDDPDSLVRKEGARGIETVLSACSPLADHYLRSLAAPDSPLAVRHRAAETAAGLLASVESQTFRGLFLRRAAEYLGLPEEQLAPRSRRVAVAPPSEPPADDRPHEPARALTVHESLIVELLLTHPEIEANLPADFERLLPGDRVRSLVRRIRDAEAPVASAEFLEELPADARNRVAKAWLGESEVYADPQRMLADCVARIEQQALERELRQLSQAIRDAERRGDGSRLQALLAEKQRLASTARQER
ncbi:MAG: hypothetical protein ACREQQ_05475, partial [Candidatus Binatia bacterium]